MNDNKDPLLSISGCSSLFAQMLPHFKCIFMVSISTLGKSGGAPPKLYTQSQPNRAQDLHEKKYVKVERARFHDCWCQTVLCCVPLNHPAFLPSTPSNAGRKVCSPAVISSFPDKVRSARRLTHFESPASTCRTWIQPQVFLTPKHFSWHHDSA